MIDSSLYKELMVTDGSPDEKIISKVWVGLWNGGGRGQNIFDFEDVRGGLDGRKGMFEYNEEKTV